ncbi:MAG: NAD(P)-dependent oxidoreductase [Rhodobacteraceae bacterium]|nr:NAD(P)-dependent oxidoreductase [Paracoccaceae bacterium]
MNVGFVGLGNVGGKLAGTLLRNGIALKVMDLDPARVAEFVGRGAGTAATPYALADWADAVITCLPSPAASAAVVEGQDGILGAMGPGKFWLEMSTTDADEVKRLGARVMDRGGKAADVPVSGGVHRAATGNISVYAGCDRETFEAILPILTVVGRQVLHTGPLGSASILKVMTNYLATANLLTLCEALVTMKAAGMDMATTYEAIRISSGNSFVHETESQLILSGSRDVNFTMDLVQKDIGLFQKIAEAHGVPLEISPLMIRIFTDAQARYGQKAQSDRVIERLEEATGLSILAPGFPTELVDEEPEGRGHEVRPPR